MIKPKYPKNADISQIARSIVEHATGEPLTPSNATPPEKKPNKKNAVRHQNRKQHQDSDD